MLENLPFYVIIKWVMLLVPLAILLAWHHYQHEIYQRYQQRPTPHVFKELLSAARWRSVQIVCVWVLAVGLLAYKDIQSFQAEDTDQEETLEALDFPETPPESAQPASTAAPNPVKEAQIDELKFRYEDVFVSYFYLQRCEHADVADLALINESMAKEVAALGGDPNVQASVFSAAQGSFESIYTDTPCDPSYLEPMVRQFEAFMQKIR